MRVPANPFLSTPTHETYSLPTEVTQALEDATHEMLLAMPALPTGAVMCDVCGCGIGQPLWTNDHPSVVCLCGDEAEPMPKEPTVRVSAPFLGMTFEAPRPSNPFHADALLPTSVETKNSRYEIVEHAWRTDEAPMCTVVCTRGTFEGDSWRVPVERVVLTRDHLYVGESDLRTTAPTKVNGYPVETWA